MSGISCWPGILSRHPGLRLAVRGGLAGGPCVTRPVALSPVLAGSRGVLSGSSNVTGDRVM